jgi:predicted nucleic acid-binding protein
MARVVLLDAGPLGMVTHPRAEQNRDVIQWLKGLLFRGAQVLVPEIADYEVRRELLRLNKGVQRLDDLKVRLGYLPITTEAMLRAAEFWAQARQMGYQAAANKALDADVILAGQAKAMAGSNDRAVIATANVGHLSRFVAAQKWEEIAW